jgi:hypothetical protein
MPAQHHDITHKVNKAMTAAAIDAVCYVTLAACSTPYSALDFTESISSQNAVMTLISFQGRREM